MVLNVPLSSKMDFAESGDTSVIFYGEKTSSLLFFKEPLSSMTVNCLYW